MDDSASYVCPSCGEQVETTIDPSAGSVQEYTEDCSVCCRPNVLRLTFDDDGTLRLDVRPE